MVLAYGAGVVVDVELLPALELVGGVPVVVGDLPVGAEVETLVLAGRAPRGDGDAVATRLWKTG